MGGGPYLWISNHRDIAMDPTLVNYALMKHAWATAHISIGDNLLQNAVVADLMRLNKSFIVKRSAESNREKLRELQSLSTYVRDSRPQCILFGLLRDRDEQKIIEIKQILRY